MLFHKHLFVTWLSNLYRFTLLSHAAKCKVFKHLLVNDLTATTKRGEYGGNRQSGRHAHRNLWWSGGDNRGEKSLVGRQTRQNTRIQEKDLLWEFPPGVKLLREAKQLNRLIVWCTGKAPQGICQQSRGVQSHLYLLWQERFNLVAQQVICGKF